MEQDIATTPPPADTDTPARDRTRPTAGALVVGLALIAVGAWALVTHQDAGPPVAWEVAGLLAAGFGLAMLVRALANKRAETGHLFLGSSVALAAAGIVGAWKLLPGESLMTLWPLILVALGLALLLTMALAKVRGLLLAALGSIMAGGVALLFTLEIVPGAITEAIGDGWPLAVGLIGLCVLSTAFGRPADTAEEEAIEAEEAEGTEETEEAEEDEA